MREIMQHFLHVSSFSKCMVSQYSEGKLLTLSVLFSSVISLEIVFQEALVWAKGKEYGNN
jgi:hypothetical protein